MQLKFDDAWTLFLDRDGVINHKLENDYVKYFGEFKFLPDVRESLEQLRPFFRQIVIVTNQQGVGKKLMTQADLDNVHRQMLAHLHQNQFIIDKVYACTDLASMNSPCRKPAIGMAYQAQADFPTIDFKKSLIIGDSLSDMQFGKRAGMKTLFFHADENLRNQHANEVDFSFSNWRIVTKFIRKQIV